MKRIYRILLGCNSIMIFFVIYAIKSHIVISIFKYEWLSYTLYITCTIFFSGICLFVARFLPDEIISGGIEEVELADGSYLPSYLGYFFVALSVNDISTMGWVGGIIFVFTLFSQTLYFNPMFLLFGYKFYYLTMDNGMKLFVLTRLPIKNVKALHFDKVKRINDYTFIDRRMRNELRNSKGKR
ncbi:MAG: hypothetical protein PHR50_10920 [Lachnospiraceae bacterium]|nr:hypothetical protein [Lachnospiraceae bacterium]